MTLRQLCFYLLATSVLTACDLPPSKPLVSDFNGDSVRIQQTNVFGEGFRSEVSDAEATRLCERGGRRIAEYGSSRMVTDTAIEHFYLCVS